ncbi:MAG: biopolymer transporter ExbD [Blastocatellia bacterium]|nr:biopolymer transporter ExbD [Blastocatellia bacterium]
MRAASHARVGIGLRTGSTPEKRVKKGKNMHFPNINVTPLIDILLVLLIIFMVISPLKPVKFDAQIPQKLPHDDNFVTTDSLVVTIDGRGGYRLNQHPAGTLAELAGLMRSVLDRRPQELRCVFVKAPRSLNYGEVVKVIDVVKAAGSAPIGLQIEGLDN